MRPINADDVLSIVDDLRDQMTVEGYCAMIERIKALPSAEPEQTNSWCINSWCNDCKDDVISRAAAIRVASGYCHPANIAKELAKLPSAQPERKTGRWIEYDNSHCECPFCHVEWSYFDNEVECFNYCPNCGAKMEGEG